jgi:hypothetical protein
MDRSIVIQVISYAFNQSNIVGFIWRWLFIEEEPWFLFYEIILLFPRKDMNSTCRLSVGRGREMGSK